MNFFMMLKGDSKEEIVVGVQELSKEYPSCFFVLEDPWDKSVLTVRAARVRC